jgi:hypothetical protein
MGTEPMRTVFASFTVLLTIVLSLSFGIACGFAVIAGILHAIGYRPARQEENAPATAAIATSAGVR